VPDSRNGEAEAEARGRVLGKKRTLRTSAAAAQHARDKSSPQLPLPPLAPGMMAMSHSFTLGRRNIPDGVAKMSRQAHRQIYSLCHLGGQGSLDTMSLYYPLSMPKFALWASWSSPIRRNGPMEDHGTGRTNAQTMVAWLAMLLACPSSANTLPYARDCILVPNVLVLPTFNLVTRIACSCVMTGRRSCRMASSIHGHQSRPPAARSPEREPQNEAL
jgi:hypothetical protein